MWINVIFYIRSTSTDNPQPNASSIGNMDYSSLIGLGFSAMGFLTKTMGMIFLTWLGVVYFELDFRIYIPLLTFFWFFTHIVEAFVIKHYIEQNVPEFLQRIQIK